MPDCATTALRSSRRTASSIATVAPRDTPHTTRRAGSTPFVRPSSSSAAIAAATVAGPMKSAGPCDRP